MARSDETRAAWLDALAEMEALVDGAGDASFVPTASTPRDLGPLPDDLVPRARAVEAAQKGAFQRIKDAQRGVLAHLAALKTVPSPRAAERSVYLDVTG
ncbi:hypothetical protein [Frondihabitans cladoniiphilus]|uniref:PH domain-containing protein n=1 Tax=Frondihabitans cladoniiphilus TaxID=715785 RepID=A0ABP8VZ02_9MICO